MNQAQTAADGELSSGGWTAIILVIVFVVIIVAGGVVYWIRLRMAAAKPQVKMGVPTPVIMRPGDEVIGGRTAADMTGIDIESKI